MGVISRWEGEGHSDEGRAGRGTQVGVIFRSDFWVPGDSSSVALTYGITDLPISHNYGHAS